MAAGGGPCCQFKLGGRCSGRGEFVVTSAGARCAIRSMGLCINWTVTAPPTMSAKDAAVSLTRWRQACLDLPFDDVSDLVHFKASEIKSRLDDRADRYR